MEEEVGLEISSEKNVAVVAFKATAMSNYEGITAASEQIKQFIEKNCPSGIVFDFAQVKFFSSQVLGLLLEIRAMLENSGGKVVISAIEPQLHRVFTITNLNKIFTFFPDKESAVRAIQVD